MRGCRMFGCYSGVGLLTHWGWATHLCVSKLAIIASYNGLSPVRRQAIIWTNAGIFLIGPLGTNFSEILIENYIFSFKKIHLRMLFAIWWPFCLYFNILTRWPLQLGDVAVILDYEFSNSKFIARISILGISCEIALSCKPQDLTD